MGKFSITGGVRPSALKFVIYGPEGIGKTTFASCFPKAVFIDTEGSTKFFNVDRFPAPTSWEMLLEEVDDIITEPYICDTLVIDTADWAEKLCVEKVCSSAKKNGIEDFGYGKGYTYVYEEFAKLLHKLDDVVERGVNVVLTAHAALRKFEQPDENGAYDRWEMKLINAPKANISAMVKEWSDVIIFANYQTYVTASDDKGKNFKASGNKRVMYLNHHPCWDAKNRFGLQDGMDFLFGNIFQILIPREQINTPAGELHVYEQRAAVINEAFEAAETAASGTPVDETMNTAKTIPNKKNESSTSKNVKTTVQHTEKINSFVDTSTRGAPPGITDGNIPKKLRDLMDADSVTENELREAVGLMGYYPESTPISTYDPEFIDGAIIAEWRNLVDYIRNTVRDLPF